MIAAHLLSKFDDLPTEVQLGHHQLLYARFGDAIFDENLGPDIVASFTASISEIKKEPKWPRAHRDLEFQKV